eukprot:7562279-Alexandrium_andersonii.AAC.1
MARFRSCLPTPPAHVHPRFITSTSTPWRQRFFADIQARRCAIHPAARRRNMRIGRCHAGLTAQSHGSAGVLCEWVDAEIHVDIEQSACGRVAEASVPYLPCGVSAAIAGTEHQHSDAKNA